MQKDKNPERLQMPEEAQVPHKPHDTNAVEKQYEPATPALQPEAPKLAPLGHVTPSLAQSSPSTDIAALPFPESNPLLLL